MGVLEPVVISVVVVTTAVALHALVVRARTRTRPEHIEIAHAAMGLGMCAMHLPIAIPTLAWTALFIVLAGLLATMAMLRRTPRYLHHAVGSLAMAYMYAAPRDSAGAPTSMQVATGHHHMPGPTMTMATHAPGYALPLLAWLLIIYCILSAGFAGTDVARNHNRRTATIELVLSAAMAEMFLTTL